MPAAPLHDDPLRLRLRAAKRRRAARAGSCASGRRRAEHRHPCRKSALTSASACWYARRPTRTKDDAMADSTQDAPPTIEKTDEEKDAVASTGDVRSKQVMASLGGWSMSRTAPASLNPSAATDAAPAPDPEAIPDRNAPAHPGGDKDGGQP